MSLKEYQSDFTDIMLQGQGAETPNIFKQDDIPVAERLNVYRNNVIGALCDVIIQTFPLLKALVGEEFLRALAEDFVTQNPPKTGNLNHYGRGLDTFIKTHNAAQKLPYLSDIAALEIAVNEAYYASDDTPLNPENLATIQPESLADLSLKPRTSMHLLSSKYPLMDIRDLCLNPDHNEPLDINAGSINLMILRPDITVQFHELEEDEHHWLSALQSAALGAATEATLAAYPSFNLNATLQKHISLETFQA